MKYWNKLSSDCLKFSFIFLTINLIKDWVFSSVSLFFAETDKIVKDIETRSLALAINRAGGRHAIYFSSYPLINFWYSARYFSIEVRTAKYEINFILWNTFFCYQFLLFCNKKFWTFSFSFWIKINQFLSCISHYFFVFLDKYYLSKWIFEWKEIIRHN